MVLTASDGNKFAAYFALAEKPTGAGMVVMPDVRGLHHFYKELAQRFAEAGIDAVAIDGPPASATAATDSITDLTWRKRLPTTSATTLPPPSHI
jgi:carboxymethylenebutenolidase